MFAKTGEEKVFQRGYWNRYTSVFQPRQLDYIKKLEDRFEFVQKQEPHLSSLMQFALAVTGSGCSERTIQDGFRKFVETADFVFNFPQHKAKDKKMIIGILNTLARVNS